MELPPRTRRILGDAGKAVYQGGTTSAYAENTIRAGHVPKIIWNYLRVRGEYPNQAFRVFSVSELPPRTRRIQQGATILRKGGGTTSAYAENTATLYLPSVPIGNYLRVRGEYNICSRQPGKILELPPRTRRIPVVEHGGHDIHGTTSAYAENTLNELGLL